MEWYLNHLGGPRIAVRQNGVLTYLHADALGRASLATTVTGTLLSQRRYLPYGETRWSSDPFPTNRRCTGQREEVTLGVYDYGARMYDASLGRFISADSIVPEPGQPQSLNRYMYVLGNPLRYVDPTGHFTKDQVEQHLREQGYSEDEISSIIYMWMHNSEHQDWWALLMEAKPGDVLNGVDVRKGTGFDRLWNGMFLYNDEGKLIFRYVNYEVLFNVATFYSDNPFDAESNIRQDIILGRRGTELGLAADDYVFHTGTDIFAGGIPNMQPNRGKLSTGFVNVGGGALLMAHAIGEVLIGAFTSPTGIGLCPLVVGLGELSLGIKTAEGGFKDWISYFDEVNSKGYVQRRLELIGP